MLFRSKKGFVSHGIELNQQQGSFIRNNLKMPCEQKLLSEESFDGKKFDVIYHCDVASHFYDPVADFKMMHKKLNDNGTLVFETGNLGDVEKKHFRYIEKLQYPDHLFFFTEKNLETLLEKAGFKIVKTHRYNILPQLKLIKLLKRIFNKKNETIVVNSKTLSQKNKRSKIKKLLNNSYQYLSYFFRYKLGAIVSKNKKPQTLIFIARKGRAEN